MDFHDLKNEIRLFENPFTVDVSSAPTDLQLELIDLECQTSLHDKFRGMRTINYYAALPAESFPNLRKQALKMITMFTSTYVCEQTFSVMKRAKPVLRNRLTDDHLDSVLRLSVSRCSRTFRS